MPKENENSTPFKTFTSNLRNEYELSLRGMAEALEISPGFLCAIENGSKPVPEEYISLIATAFDLNEERRKELARSVYETNGYITISKNNPLWADVLDYKVECYEQ